jgi:sec-independent protein translocase protein TatC
MLKIEDKPTTLYGHFTELKKRILYCVIAFFVCTCFCYLKVEAIYQFLLRPLVGIYHDHSHQMIYTGLTEAFFTYLKLAVFAGFLMSFPIIASQIYIFLAPGLYRNERMVLLPYLIAGPVLFLLGGMMVYYFIFPVAWKFFLSFEVLDAKNNIPIKFEARISEYLSLVMHLIMAFGVAFQLPVVLTLLARAGILDTAWLIKKRKVAIIIIFTIAAVITPPDAISQIALAVPMMILYEASIFACKLIEKNRGQDA